MDRRFHPRHEATARRLFVELLESRALFSGVPFTETVSEQYGPLVSESTPASSEAGLNYYEAAPAVTEPSAGFNEAVPVVETANPELDATAFTPTIDQTVVEVVEIGTPESTNNIVQPIPEADIPQSIVDAVDSKFPGAELVVAEGRDDNGAPVYEVQTEFEGRPIGVTLTNDGNILDTAYTVSPTELPQPVQDWVEDNFPGSEIGTAELVTQSDGVSYDLLIATEAGGFITATVRLQSVKTPRDPIAVSQEYVGAVNPTASEDEQVPTEEQLAAGEAPSDAPPELKAADKSTDRAESSAATVVDEGEETGDDSAKEVATLTAAEQIAFEELAAELEDQPLEGVCETLETTTLPVLTAAIDELLAIDIEAVEQSLMQLVADVDEFVDSVASSASANGLATCGGLVAALIVGARVYVLESKRRKLDPALANSVSTSTWGWLLAATTPVPQN